MAAYSSPSIPLDVPFEKKEIVKAGTQIPDITVLRLPAGAIDTVFLHVGADAEPIPLIQGMALHITPPETTGVYLTSTAAVAGQSLRLLLGYVVGAPAQQD